jgi:flap endonuclease-1
MSESFLRRTQIPTDQTYQERKEILQAMGIPCIDAADATEAEALASAIVHQGLADFVASENAVRKLYLKHPIHIHQEKLEKT